jgi:hypothetical protein
MKYSMTADGAKIRMLRENELWSQKHMGTIIMGKMGLK